MVCPVNKDFFQDMLYIKEYLIRLIFNKDVLNTKLWELIKEDIDILFTVLLIQKHNYHKDRFSWIFDNFVQINAFLLL